MAELYRDHFQNFKRYNIPKAQLVIVAECAQCGASTARTDELHALLNWNMRKWVRRGEDDR